MVCRILCEGTPQYRRVPSVVLCESEYDGDTDAKKSRSSALVVQRGSPEGVLENLARSAGTFFDRVIRGCCDSVFQGEGTGPLRR